MSQVTRNFCEFMYGTSFVFQPLHSKHWLGGGTETNGVICYRYQTLGQN